MQNAFAARLRAVVLLSLLTCVLPAGAGDGKWTPIQPGGGVASALVPASEMLFLVSSEHLYASTDDGQSWTLHAELPSYITALAIDPDDPELMFAGTGFNGVMRSTDGGSTWETRGLDEAMWFDDTPVTDVVITDDRVYAGTLGYGVFVSVDAGETWAPTSAQPDDQRINELAVDPNAPGAVYAGTSTKGVYRTSDRGASWQCLTEGFKLGDDYETGEMHASVLTIVPGTPSVIYAASIHGALIARSVNGGVDWETVSMIATGLPADSAAVRAITYDTANPDVLYAVFDSLYSVDDSPLYRSDDGGLSWTGLGKPVAGQLGPNGLSLHVTDDGTVVFGGHRGIWRVAPDSSSWTVSNSGFNETPIGKIARAYQGSERIVAVGRNVFPYVSNDSGSTWSNLDDGRIPTADFEAVAINPADDDEIWLGQAGKEGLLQSNDGGATWTQELVGVTDDTSPWVTQIAVDPVNPDTVLAVSEGGEIFITNDGGATWSVSWEGLPPPHAYPFANALEIAPSDPSIVYFATADGLFKSMDGGHTWEARIIEGAGKTISTLAVDPSDADIVYAGSSRNGLWRSTDGGTNWSPVGPASARTMAIHPRNGQKLLVAGNHRVYASNDGGATWSDLTANLDTGPTGSIYVSDVLFEPIVDDRYYIANDGTLAVYDGPLPKGSVIGDRDTGEDDDGNDDGAGGTDGGDDTDSPGSTPGSGGGGSLAWLVPGALVSIRLARRKRLAISN